MDIKYSIKFHTDWHCGSGLAAGADVDALVVKDKDGLPFVPGKTLKGLVREAIEEMELIDGRFNENLFIQAFGNSEDRNADPKLMGKSEDYDFLQKGETFFTNAELSEDEHRAIVSNNAARFMYRSISSTAIDNEGIAVEVYPDACKLKKQFDYAERKAIPFLSITGGNEAAEGVVNIKNLASGEQKSFRKEDVKAIVDFLG